MRPLSRVLTLFVLGALLASIVAVVSQRTVVAQDQTNSFSSASLSLAAVSATTSTYYITEAGWSGWGETNDRTDGWGDQQWQITLSSPKVASITVRDDFIVGDYYEVYVDSTRVGMTPEKQMYDSTSYSQATIRATIPGGTHMIRIRDKGGAYYANHGYPFMIPAGYWVEISFASPQSGITLPQNFLQGDSRWNPTDPATGAIIQSAHLDNNLNCWTIQRGGCSITAIADVFAYYGTPQLTDGFGDVNPYNLNRWMSANPKEAVVTLKDGTKVKVIVGRGFGVASPPCGPYWSQITPASGGYAAGPSLYLESSYTAEARKKAIDDALAKGEPPIVRVKNSYGNHYIVLTGVSGDSYTIADPLGKTGTLKTEYNGVFYDVIIYHAGDKSPKKALQIVGHSPIELLVASPHGSSTGYDPSSGSYVEDIPLSSYGFEPGLDDAAGLEPSLPGVVLFQQIEPMDGTYSVQVIGTGDGPYLLEFRLVNPDGTVSLRTVEGTAKKDTVETFEIKLSGSGIDMPGDVLPPITTPSLSPTPNSAGWNNADVTVTLSATDNEGGSGVASTQYSLNSGAWTDYAGPFVVSTESMSGTVHNTVQYRSADNAGNIEDVKSVTIKIDKTSPVVTADVPLSGEAIQDGTKFGVKLADALSGPAGVTLSVREANGADVNAIGYENLPTALNSTTSDWELSSPFDSTKVPDGYYVLVAEGKDVAGNTTKQVIPFSIRNWAVVKLLPATENNKAGRTMPVKFSLRVSDAVDPKMPFVRNTELTVKVSAPGVSTQSFVYGPKASDFRIDDKAELYISNYQTDKTPKEYTVEIFRKDFLVGSFLFQTTK